MAAKLTADAPPMPPGPFDFEKYVAALKAGKTGDEVVAAAIFASESEPISQPAPDLSSPPSE